MYGDANIMYGMPVSCMVMQVSCMVMPVSCMVEESLPRVHIYKQVGPRFVENAVFKPPERNIEMYLKCLQEYQVWMLTRVIGSSETKQISSVFAGFISCTGMNPKRKSTIDHFTPITNPFTEYSNAEELLRVSEIATAEVGQDYVLNTDT